MAEFVAVEELGAVKAAVSAWAKAFQSGAVEIGNREAGVFYHAPLQVWGLMQPWSDTNQKFYNVFGIEPSFSSKVVQVHPAYAPISAGREAGLVARDGHGRLWVLHNGRMTTEDGRISRAQFAAVAGTASRVAVEMPYDAVADYYRVACLDAPAAEVQRQTASFVHTCQKVRQTLHNNAEVVELPASKNVWTDDELATAVASYVAMLRLELSGVSYSKTAYRKRALAAGLSGQSGASLERCMQNISWILQADGREWIKGYKPLSNIGKAEKALRALLAEHLDAALTDDPSVLEKQVAAARKRIQLGDGEGAPPPAGQPAQHTGAVKRFDRSRDVIAWVLVNARGTCEACGEIGPFFRGPEDVPYLEVHHVRPLAEGGPDQVDNAAAVCPNCHRRLHLSNDSAAFRRKLLDANPRLKDHPILPVKVALEDGAA